MPIDISRVVSNPLSENSGSRKVFTTSHADLIWYIIYLFFKDEKKKLQHEFAYKISTTGPHPPPPAEAEA